MDANVMPAFAIERERLVVDKETSLILAARSGDIQAFNQLVLLYKDRIFNLSVRILGDASAAEDITQNTFITAFLNLRTLHSHSFKSWLYRIAINTCIDEYRRNKRYLISSIDSNDVGEESFASLIEHSNPGLSPEIEVEMRELEQFIQSALSQLDADQRVVVILVDQQDFDYQEVAQALHIPIGTVKSRLARARLRMRAILSQSNLVGSYTAYDYAGVR
jgi:RNA polymerase sigma factor (sigma-70 family)